MEKKKMVELTCQHCERTWNYKGQQEHQTTCPRCGYKVNIKKGQERAARIRQSSRGTPT